MCVEMGTIRHKNCQILLPPYTTAICCCRCTRLRSSLLIQAKRMRWHQLMLRWRLCWSNCMTSKRALFTTQSAQSFTCENRPIVFLSDPPHLMKTKSERRSSRKRWEQRKRSSMIWNAERRISAWDMTVSWVARIQASEDLCMGWNYNPRPGRCGYVI